MIPLDLDFLIIPRYRTSIYPLHKGGYNGGRWGGGGQN